MPLNEQEKNDARDIIAGALAFNEPESMIAGLQRLAMRKASEAGEWPHERGYALMSDNERARWRKCAEALQSVANELEHANAPQKTLAHVSGLSPSKMAQTIDKLVAQDETSAAAAQTDRSGPKPDC